MMGDALNEATEIRTIQSTKAGKYVNRRIHHNPNIAQGTPELEVLLPFLVHWLEPHSYGEWDVTLSGSCVDTQQQTRFATVALAGPRAPGRLQFGRQPTPDRLN